MYTFSYNLFKEPHLCENPRSDPVVAAIPQRGSSKALSGTVSPQHHHLLEEKSALSNSIIPLFSSYGALIFTDSFLQRTGADAFFSIFIWNFFEFTNSSWRTLFPGWAVTLHSSEVNSQRNKAAGLYKLAPWLLRKFYVIIVLLYADSWG